MWRVHSLCNDIQQARQGLQVHYSRVLDLGFSQGRASWVGDRLSSECEGGVPRWQEACPKWQARTAQVLQSARSGSERGGEQGRACHRSVCEPQQVFLDVHEELDTHHKPRDSQTVNAPCGRGPTSTLSPPLKKQFAWGCKIIVRCWEIGPGFGGVSMLLYRGPRLVWIPRASPRGSGRWATVLRCRPPRWPTALLSCAGRLVREGEGQGEGEGEGRGGGYG